MPKCPGCESEIDTLIAESLNQLEFSVDEDGVNYDNVHNQPEPIHAYRCSVCEYQVAEHQEEAEAFLRKAS